MKMPEPEKGIFKDPVEPTWVDGLREGEGQWFPDGSGCVKCRRDELKPQLRRPPCGIQWCGVTSCPESSTDMVRLRLALATARERCGFLSPNDVDACGRW